MPLMIQQAMSEYALRRMKWSWVGYGAAAYVALRLMRRYGVFAEPADRILHVMEDGARHAVRSVAPGLV